MYQYLINFSLLNIVKIYQEDWQKETDTLSARRNSTNHTWGGLSCFYLQLLSIQVMQEEELFLQEPVNNMHNVLQVSQI